MKNTHGKPGSETSWLMNWSSDGCIGPADSNEVRDLHSSRALAEDSQSFYPVIRRERSEAKGIHIRYTFPI